MRRRFGVKARQACVGGMHFAYRKMARYFIPVPVSDTVSAPPINVLIPFSASSDNANTRKSWVGGIDINFRYYYLVTVQGTVVGQIGGRMLSGTSQIRQAGKGVIEVVVFVVVLALVVVLAVPALTKNRDAAQGLTCQDRLRQLGEAANHYADDFKERFFYHWPDIITAPDGTESAMAGWWYDSERIGKYIDNTNRRSKWLPPAPDQTKQNYKHLDELIGGSMVCPTYYSNDDKVPLRSYAMNFWASGIDDGVHVSTVTAYQGKIATGALFRRSSPKLDQLLLFTEGVIPNLDDPGISLPRMEDYFGVATSPSDRFGGARDREGRLAYPASPGPRLVSTWIIDYSRHGDNVHPSTPHGVVNIALADGHVESFSDEDLYSAAEKRSTYRVLWSVDDEEIDNKIFEVNPMRQ